MLSVYLFQQVHLIDDTISHTVKYLCNDALKDNQVMQLHDVLSKRVCLHFRWLKRNS